MVPTYTTLSIFASSLQPSGHDLILRSVSIPSHMGSVTVAAGPLSFRARSSSCQASLGMTFSRWQSWKNRRNRIILTYIWRTAAVKSVAAFPLFPASCLLIMSATSEAFSSSVQSVRKGSSEPVSVFTNALKATHSFSYTLLVFGSTAVEMKSDSSCLLCADIGPRFMGTVGLTRF
jgi:hypothetical protein